MPDDTSNPLPQSAPGTRARTLLLGLGNDLLTDDAIGLRVAAEVRARLAGHPDLAVVQTTEMGLALMDLVAGFDRVVVVDAVRTGRAAPGFVHELRLEDLPQISGMSPHFLGLGETLALGRELGLVMPAEVKILAIEVLDPYTVSTALTPELELAVPAIVARVAEAL